MRMKPLVLILALALIVGGAATAGRYEGAAKRAGVVTSEQLAHEIAAFATDDEGVARQPEGPCAFCRIDYEGHDWERDHSVVTIGGWKTCTTEAGLALSKLTRGEWARGG